ncbi:hypothetical protein F5Y19DRAFT_438315 [Xylariaceae sp. FL1651]|nr:hypothetical protein F5Y19DRAFT_438315 [Xylariaceae sp. FL1651]
MDNDPGEDRFQEWRSILTLIIFFLVNLTVIFPFHFPLYVPYRIFHLIRARLVYLSHLLGKSRQNVPGEAGTGLSSSKGFRRTSIPINFTTAPLAAVIFLLATTAMTPEELRSGILGSNNLVPLDIVAFALTIGYISGSVDASGLLRYMTFRVLQRYGDRGHRLYLYLYCLFFLAGSFFGNDPIIQMGMLVLTYMLKATANIESPRAWIFMQYAVVNIASTIFVSSGTTNVIVASAFNIGFAEYTANTVVPVTVTVLVMFPYLIYFVFGHELLIPVIIRLHELPEERKARKPINANIKVVYSMPPEEVLNPFLDKLSALVGIILMITALVVLIALSVVTLNKNEIPVFWVTLPAAFLMLCWDVISSWIHRHEVRAIASTARRERESVRAAQNIQDEAALMVHQIGLSSPQAEEALPNKRQTESREALQHTEHTTLTTGRCETCGINASSSSKGENSPLGEPGSQPVQPASPLIRRQDSEGELRSLPKQELGDVSASESNYSEHAVTAKEEPGLFRMNNHQPSRPRPLSPKLVESDHRLEHVMSMSIEENSESSVLTAKIWLEETFPTAMVVLRRLPFSVVPFAIPMFALVQALVDKGWVTLFARWWDAWVAKTGTVGAVAGMGFLSVILSNFAGTNIGATVLLCRVLQTWQQMHSTSESTGKPPNPISDRTLWGSVYAMALGVNYGAFSISFGASLAGLSWREDLASRHIHVTGLEFIKVNLPIISVAMAVGCAVLVGEVYITR